MTDTLHKQRIEEALEALNKNCASTNRSMYPGFHLAPPSGWMNDPNGVIYHKGYYHVFYQHHPFSAEEGKLIYWGHARSKDLCTWEHLPIALAPSIEEDRDGCFSGCAVVNDNDELCLIYTAHRWGKAWGDDRYVNEVQAIATSKDGVHFDNKQVVLREPPLEGVTHFRDPRVWREGNDWLMIIGYRTDDKDGKGVGKVALYRSKDLYRWTFESTLAEDDELLPPGKRSYMWECPDFFPLGDKHVLLMSPQGLEDDNKERFLNLFQNGCIIGTFKDGKFTRETEFEELDFGHEFYAAQHIDGPDGRTLLIAWFDMWANDKPSQKHGWAGMMTLPRDLHIEDGLVRMTPSPELVGLRAHAEPATIDTSVLKDGEERSLEITDGPLQELRVDIDLNATDAQEFGIEFHVDSATGARTRLYVDRALNRLVLDRELSGQSPAQSAFKRTCKLPEGDVLSLHVYLDRPSIEVFIGNDKSEGLYSMSSRTFPTPAQKEAHLFAKGGRFALKGFKRWTLKDTFHFEPLKYGA